MKDNTSIEWPEMQDNNVTGMVSYQDVIGDGQNGGNQIIEDRARHEADKRAVYKHPLFPLLCVLFERCEQATQLAELPSSETFSMDVNAFLQVHEREKKPFLTNDSEVDSLMIKAIQVLRIHLLELEKVQELCKDFCNRYITALKGKMQSENLLRSDYAAGYLENNNNSGHSSDSNSPTVFNPHSPHNIQVGAGGGGTMNMNWPTASGVIPSISDHPASPTTSIKGSTPLSQIGTNPCTAQLADHMMLQGSLSATSGGSCDEEDDPISGRRKQKRGILPKQATSVMRSWLFQHLVHPYPTEDEKRQIAAQTDLTLLQVNNWFINARRRILQPMLDSSQPDTSGGGTKINVSKKMKSSNGAKTSQRYWSDNLQRFSSMDNSQVSGDDWESGCDEGSDSGGPVQPSSIASDDDLSQH